MARFAFEDTKPVISDGELLADVSRVARELAVSSLPQRTYRLHGRYSTTAIKKRFGSWNRATLAAGLRQMSERDIPEELLHSNLESVWIRLGRQPRKRDMAPPVSRFSHHPYVRRYGGWLDAIRGFLRVVESSDEGDGVVKSQGEQAGRGPRDPSLRLRFLVMRRDHFSCLHCGASPAKDPRVELHVDHIVPWSQGGRTVLANLQTLCIPCNLGKSNLHERAGGRTRG
jgi:hypothetical protein